MLLLFLSGCASVDEADHMRAWIAPFCIFNCVVGVTYAPGIERLYGGMPTVNH